MALFSFPTLFLALSLCLLLISPTHCLTCKSQNFTTNKVFTKCSDLPTLNARLHYTYNARNSSLSIAFIATPAKSNGWIGWGINPNGTGMVGAQALVTLKSNGALVVKTFNLESYGAIKEEKLSFDVWDLSAESSGEDFVMFASVKVPEKAETVNQIWQVGASVTNGKPDRHELAVANKQAMAPLALAATQSGNSTNSTTPSASAPSATTNTPSSNTTGGASSGYRIKEMYMGLFVGLLALLGSLFGF